MQPSPISAIATASPVPPPITAMLAIPRITSAATEPTAMIRLVVPIASVSRRSGSPLICASL